jgi:hypothetical protein
MFEVRRLKADFSGTGNETDVPTGVAEALFNALMREVYCDGILMALADINTIEEYPEYMGTTFAQACYDYLMKYSDDGTLQSGIDGLIADTGDEHYEYHVGYIVGGRMNLSGKHASRDYDLWNEEEEEAACRRNKD